MMHVLSSIPNILLIILGFGVLIFIHELGHFVAAKWANVRTEAFAVGMGPVALAWRKGIGLRFGSTGRDVERRIDKHLKSTGVNPESLSADDNQRRKQIARAMDSLGIGETEYSLRWLPIGGFVKMLGQEDANPNYVSDDPRSYNMCPVSKRMVIVSAGVIMNLLLAVVLFIVAFLKGVKFEAPVVGEIVPDHPAATAVASNASELGVTTPGLKPGDLVTHTDGEPAETFADLQIASAMSKPNVPVLLTVKRAGVAQPLQFSILPVKDGGSGLLSIGITPGSSTTLINHNSDFDIAEALARSGAPAAIQPGMVMTAVNGQGVTTYEQFQRALNQSNGSALQTTWTMTDSRGQANGPEQQITVEPKPDFQPMMYPDDSPGVAWNFEMGLLGLTPLVRIADVPPGTQNEGVLKPGDIILRLGSVDAPRIREFFETIQRQPAGPIDMLVLRDGLEVQVTATVSRKGLLKSKGMLNVLASPGQMAWEVPLIARPLEQVSVITRSGDSQTTFKVQRQVRDTPIAGLRLMGRDRVDAVGSSPVANWADLREQLRLQTAAAYRDKTSATVSLTITHPTPGHEQEVVTLQIPADDVASLHALGWHSSLSPEFFEPIYRVLDAGGNPLRAIAMGFHRTYNTVALTYLTLDRLFRGSVGINQLRGPLGIVHIGTKVADRGIFYVVFFLGMISVNLAVINFLPLPIVDGGLFLFLIYEKLKGRPPSLAFQNAATIAGICLIGTIFLITFYNDVMRLIS